MKSPILGSAYVARSVNAADNRMVNLFPEAVPEGGKEPGFLTRAPGLRLLATIGAGPIRGMWQFGAYAYVVSGTTLYKVDTAYTATSLGTIVGSGPVSMSDNGTQLMIVANPNGYIYNSSTGVFGQITDPDYPGAVTVSYLDGYFVFNEPDSQRIWVTSLLDGTTIDPLDFASAEGAPDGLVACIVDHREAWLFGTASVEVWYDAGLADFPLARIQGAFNEIGCAAPYSIAKLDNGLFWLGSDARGKGIVYRANGYTGQRISTHAVEWQIQQYTDISDAVGYTYQQEGHAFYVLNFPLANTTWVYDVATQAWHERASFSDGALNRHRGSCQVQFNGETIVGDYQDGRIYAFDTFVYADDTAIQKWIRSWRALPTGQNNLKRSANHSLQIDLETGVGDGVTEDPQMMLRWSDDGGHTWSSEHWMSVGKIGEYLRRAIRRRLGMTQKLRDRVYEISGSDPVKITIMGAELLISGTNA
jgi:Phage stabilisation protein